MANNPIFVTMPSLAPLEEYTALLKEIWQNNILTHNGPLVQRLERDISSKLGLVDFVSASNGTIAIQMAIKALELRGEIITTPFTWIATVSAIQLEGCKPVFVDIDPDTLNINTAEIERHITSKTVAIMPVHVFGNPCDILGIQTIADRCGLKVIYDAAHAVGSSYCNQSVLNYGDISATSLHATKLLNTAEGGGCVTTNPELINKLKRIRFFGHDDSKAVVEEGMNGKMTEIHAALGLANMKYYDLVLADRKRKYLYYLDGLKNLKNARFQTLQFGESNYSYFAIIFDREDLLIETIERLEAEKIYARRYFYPAVNTFTNLYPYHESPVAEDISRRILCLPLYWKLEDKNLDRIIRLVSYGN